MITFLQLSTKIRNTLKLCPETINCHMQAHHVESMQLLNTGRLIGLHLSVCSVLQLQATVFILSPKSCDCFPCKAVAMYTYCISIKRVQLKIACISLVRYMPPISINLLTKADKPPGKFELVGSRVEMRLFEFLPALDSSRLVRMFSVEIGKMRWD